MNSRSSIGAPAVLIAEDDPQVQMLLAMRMRDWGLALTFVGDGRRAVASALEKSFALIILDLRLPIIDGHGVLRLLREAKCASPVLAFSAGLNPHDEERLRKDGFCGALCKPFTREQLQAAIRTGLPDFTFAGNERSVVGDAVEALKNAFISGLAARGSQLSENVAHCRWPEVTRQAHELAAAPLYGLDRLGYLASELEAAVNRGEMDKIPDLLTDLKSEIAVRSKGSE